MNLNVVSDPINSSKFVKTDKTLSKVSINRTVIEIRNYLEL